MHTYINTYSLVICMKYGTTLPACFTLGMWKLTAMRKGERGRCSLYKAERVINTWFEIYENENKGENIRQINA
jgi:hypothetical protein